MLFQVAKILTQLLLLDTIMEPWLLSFTTFISIHIVFLEGIVLYSTYFLWQKNYKKTWVLRSFHTLSLSNKPLSSLFLQKQLTHLSENVLSRNQCFWILQRKIIRLINVSFSCERQVITQGTKWWELLLISLLLLILRYAGSGR